MNREAGSRIHDYNSEVKQLCTVSCVEEFWGIYQRLKRPGELGNISDYHFFKKDIRPIWEVCLINAGQPEGRQVDCTLR